MTKRVYMQGALESQSTVIVLFNPIVDETTVCQRRASTDECDAAIS